MGSLSRWCGRFDWMILHGRQERFAMFLDFVGRQRQGIAFSEWTSPVTLLSVEIHLVQPRRRHRAWPERAAERSRQSRVTLVEQNHLSSSMNRSLVNPVFARWYSRCNSCFCVQSSKSQGTGVVSRRRRWNERVSPNETELGWP